MVRRLEWVRASGERFLSTTSSPLPGTREKRSGHALAAHVVVLRYCPSVWSFHSATHGLIVMPNLPQVGRSQNSRNTAVQPCLQHMLLLKHALCRSARLNSQVESEFKSQAERTGETEMWVFVLIS
jgi:hypothetical protein